MKAMKFCVASAIVLLLAATPGAADDGALEALDPATALAGIRASRGVVFVDLYADW
jgi:hypothetical protein